MSCTKQEFNISQIPEKERQDFALLLMAVLDEHSNRWRLADAQLYLDITWERYCGQKRKKQEGA